MRDQLGLNLLLLDLSSGCDDASRNLKCGATDQVRHVSVPKPRTNRNRTHHCSAPHCDQNKEDHTEPHKPNRTAPHITTQRPNSKLPAAHHNQSNSKHCTALHCRTVYAKHAVPHRNGPHRTMARLDVPQGKITARSRTKMRRIECGRTICIAMIRAALLCSAIWRAAAKSTSP